MPERTIQVNGLNISLREEGQGEPFLILHGWGSGKGAWKDVQDSLAKEFRVIMFDFPGFGKSDLLPEAWSVSDFVDFFDSLLKELNIPDGFYLASQSFGCRVAIKFAVKYPGRIKRLFLIDAAGIRHKKATLTKILHVFSIVLNKFSWVPGYKLFRRAFYKLFLNQTNYLDAQGTKKETYLKVIAEDLTGFLDQIKVKTYILWGERDDITPLEDAYLMHNKIKDSELRILSWGHIPYKENPQLLAKTILEFTKL